MKFKFLIASVIFSLSSTVMAGGAQDAIDAAKKAYKAADEAGMAWRDMGKAIKNAEAAAKDGKDEKAIKLANMVVMQSKQSLKQAELAKTAGPRF